MSKLKTDKKPNPHARHIVVTFKANAEEMHDFIKKAHLFTKGNISKWLRFAGRNHNPRKEDLEK